MTAAIASAVRQPDATEVIVVIDHEDELLARTRRAWEGATGVPVAIVPNDYRQGLSGARNTGVERAKGDIVAFLDDDAVAADDWLVEMLAAYDSPDVVGVGGSAQPMWPGGKKPTLLPPELYWIVGCSYRGLPESRADVRNAIGCSMSIRREPLLGIGAFNLEAGRVGTHPVGAEETEVCIQLRLADRTRRIVYEPRSRVRHRVTAERVTWRYLRTRSYYEGISKAALSKTLGSLDALESERSYTLRVLPLAVLRELRHGRPSGAAGIVLSLASAAAGYLYGTVNRGTSTARRTPVAEGIAQ
jgi:cellulose synthase/poly-beta-1,6-N-acetylglucosamine synthase-like glycosyltransferase